ncbi:polysaccharide biosynthesis/export family protein [Lunatimonas salinarum]|uniref:polysaccharide biosynthesis/export family protein n=1 Tax=Lunatimonas salinarum TaxID=1774590 RepID=UPI003158133C
MITMRILVLFLALLSFSCAKRNLVYFSDIASDSAYTTKIGSTFEPKIQTGDLLRITVSSLNAESNLLFNAGILNTQTDVRQATNLVALNQGYLVDKEGDVNFPVIGKIKLVGKTKEEAVDEVTRLVTEHVKDPIVNVSFLNFKVTVIGEVARPGTFTLENDRITLLEALGMAGDMTQFGKRENVLIIRDEGGERKAVRINLNNKEVLNSPYYLLQQNDIVYVEPDKMKAIQATTNQRSLSLLAILSSLGVALLFNLRWYIND